MERRGGSAGIEPAEALDRVGRRQTLDLDVSLAELLESPWVGLHPPVGARADDQALRQLVKQIGKSTRLNSSH